MMLTRDDIDQIAAYDRTMTEKSSVKEWLYYYCVSALFSDYNKGKITKKEASARKKDLISYLDTVEGLAHSNSIIIKEIARNTAPRSELVHKDKAELLEVINRIEGVVTGLMNKYDGKVPEFLKAR
jgi:hypothetical protein